MNNPNSPKGETAVTVLNEDLVKKIDTIDVSFETKIVSMNSNVNNQDKTYIFLKRAVDLCGSFLGLILLSPVLILLIALIKIEDQKSPVFFSQKRVGLNGELFTMYKFRSMIQGAESQLELLMEKNETTGPMFKMSNDPRVTKIGRFIRKTSLDELPQLWNVLKGDMSLVGPRPPLPREVLNYTSYDMQRLKVVPGCTGLWQISGRSDLGFNEMVDLDIQYINQRNIKMDVWIIFSTIKVMISSKGAY